MGIIQKLNEGRAFSLEFFPPKKETPLSSVFEAIEMLSAYNPCFVSVTYGAGGGNRDGVVDIASYIKNAGLEAIAHLTCAGSDHASVDYILTELKSKGINNVLAIRGDVPEGMSKEQAFSHYRYASDLIAEIKQRGGFTIGAAAYPEGHVGSDSLEKDIEFMKLKQDAGADFFATQLCFDRHAVLSFYEKAYGAGITVPVIIGIMPVLNPNQITRMALLSACSIPASLSKIISRYGSDAEAFKKAGLEYAIEEIEYLMDNGIGRFHIYTMNKPDVAEQIILGSRLKDII